MRNDNVSPPSLDGPQGTDDLPAGLGSPARRALAAAGYTRLDQLAGVTGGELLRLHGMGPKAMQRLVDALAARGWSLAGADHGTDGRGES